MMTNVNFSEKHNVRRTTSNVKRDGISIKKLAIFVVLVVLMLLSSGCTLLRAIYEPLPAGWQLNRPIQIRYGQTVLLGYNMQNDNLKVAFTEILEDSRCPKQVTCAWSGNARIVITLQQGNAEPSRYEVDVNSSLDRAQPTTEEAAYGIELVKLDPYPEQPDHPIPLHDYVATIVITGGSPELPNTTPTATPAELMADIEAQLDQPFEVPIRQWAILANTADALGVQVFSVEQDSRCPAQVMCFRQGEVKLMLGVRLGESSAPTLLPLSSDPANSANQAQYEGYAIELLDVQPAPQQDAASKEIAAEDYRFTLVVHQHAVEPTPTPLPTPTPTELPTPISSDENSYAMALDQPFTLREGQQAQITSEDLHVTLRSITPDSGCFAENDCSIMTADGSLALQKGDQRELDSFTVSFSPDSPFRLEFAGYAIDLVAIKKLSDGGPLATYVVHKTNGVNPDQPVAAPPQFVEGCPNFSRFDAAAILQEDVKEPAVANLLFGPALNPESEPQGLCGYGSAIFTADKTVDVTKPHLATAIDADYAVVAAEVPGQQIADLNRIIDVIRTANPEASADLEAKLFVSLVAGDWAGLFSTLGENLEASPTFHLQPVEPLGEEAIWAWQEFSGGRFATLIDHQNQGFIIIAALLPETADEQATLGAAILVAKKLEQ
jgi:hypothetical protein